MKLSNKMLQKPDFWQKELVKSLENLVFFLVSKWHWLIPTPIGALAHDPKMEIEFAKIKWRQWNFTPIYRAAKNGHLVIITSLRTTVCPSGDEILNQAAGTDY